MILNHVNNIVYIHWILDIAKRHWESLVSSQTLENYYWVLLDHNIKIFALRNLLY